jgi:hypothetical protein
MTGTRNIEKVVKRKAKMNDYDSEEYARKKKSKKPTRVTAKRNFDFDFDFNF